MATSIQEISYTNVKPLIKYARHDKVCLKDTETTKWFGIYEKDRLCGVAGSIAKDGKGRIRGVFVLQEHRGKSYGSTLMNHLMTYFSNNNVNYVDQLSSHPEWWLEQGWQSKSIVKNGQWIYKNI